MNGSNGDSRRRLSTMLDPIMDVSNDNFSMADADADEDNNDNKSLGSGSESGQSSGDFHDRRKSVVVEEIAGRENRLVLISKLFVFLVLACSAAAVGVLTFYFVSSEEENDYTAQFANDATELIGISNQNAKNIFGVLGIFSTLISSSARHDNATWPLFTLPDFEFFGKGSRELSGALLLAFTPLVANSTRAAWEEYSVANQGWIQEGLEVLGKAAPQSTRGISADIYQKTTRANVAEIELPQYSPVWQLSPAPSDPSLVNFNLFNEPTYQRLVEFAIFTRQSAISEVLDTEQLFGTAAPQKGKDPQSIIVLPVFSQTGDSSSDIIGHIVAVIPWGLFFQDVLQEGQDGVYAVLRESCGSSFTYVINGRDATFLAEEDVHDTAYDDMKRSTSFVTYDGDLEGISDGGLSDHCEYTLDVYPSKSYEEMYQSSRPAIFTVGVILVFVFTSIVFVMYDCFVRQRQQKVNRVAVKSNAIVTSLFPAQVRDKLFEDDKNETSAKDRKVNPFKRANAGSDDMMSSMNGGGGYVEGSAPIADLFPSATVLFMDIAGFTSWSSAREPTQVFILLETLYHCFDKIAKHRRVFKVETIGDCYVAVCGLPEPEPDHAVVVARFARDCLAKMDEMLLKLEVTLGPDTTDLAMRVGFHSGPVTAGVLRGERARFQLFGDTVNTAARMESTGVKTKIQVSQESAELIIASGKSAWIKPREERVVAKGKGELQTYWLLPKNQSAPSVYSSNSPSEGLSESGHIEALDLITAAQEDGSEQPSPESIAMANKHVQRLVEYNCDILLQILKKVVAKRAQTKTNTNKKDITSEKNLQKLEDRLGKTGNCLEEVAEVIHLPKFDSAAYNDSETSEMSKEVVSQLSNYVEAIASMYRNNPFHNFDHASHVTQSTSKLLSRIVACKEIEKGEQMHDHTYGITSDPLTQFAVMFSSLIHDVDHRGVPNFLLAKEDPSLGAIYNNQAVAEQNSVDVAWNLLMEPAFGALRRAIYTNASEMRRFRQLVVNSLMATDIFDKELSALRKNRWQTAFHAAKDEENPETAIDRKATIVIEHIIQASDVSHTMQHWHIYSKWNERLYHEMFNAYCQGRSDEDPTDGWYNGELWFFDNYVIPLANKLKECGVFGVSSDEYLNYAQANRREWEKKGKEIVAANFDKFKKELRHREKK